MFTSQQSLPVLNAVEPDGTPCNHSECNFDTVGDYFFDQTDDEEFLVTALGATEEQELYKNVPYCDEWRKRSGLFLEKPLLVRRSYEHKRELGLFTLFLNGSFLQCMRQWTSKELCRRGKRTKTLRMDELLAYIGLELAASIHRLNRLRDYWCASDLLGIPFFKKVMGRDLFLNIRSALRMYPAYESEGAVADPLWHSRQVLEHFARNSAPLAVPVGVSSLDENTIRCKGRTRARSYMKSKPVKFGIRFYAVVGWSHAYLHSFQDNGSGNKTGQSPLQRYTNVLWGLRGAVERKVDGKLLSKSSASALWCAQMAHQTYLHPMPGRERLMVMDNFYTRHSLALQLRQLSDDECKVLGTVRFNNVDGANRPALKEAIESLKHAKRGDWRLVQVYEKGPKAGDPHTVSEKTGFIVFKNRSVVSLYTNDLADTPRARIHTPDEHAIMCVHDLAPLQRWIGEEAMRRTTLQVPAVIVAYNLFMNGVDRFDQFRSSSATVRRERRVTMSLLTFILDASILNSHALLNAITPSGDALLDVSTMKQRLIMQLVGDHIEYKQKRASLTVIPAVEHGSTEHCAGDTDSEAVHIVLETNGRKRVHCIICRLLSKPLRQGYTTYSCTACRRGYHLNCFSLYHNREMLKGIRPDVYQAMYSAERLLHSKPRRNRSNTVTSTLANAHLVYKS